MRPAHISALAKAVAHNFMVAGFSTADLLTGAIEITDVVWQNPPLMSEEPLGGYAFQDYVNAPSKVNPEQLYKFWRWGLDALYAVPASVCTLDGWKGLTAVLPSASAGERALRFCIPEDFPKHNPISGHVFTMEVTHLFATSTSAASNLVSDSFNYYVETLYGPVGILDGQIIENDAWGESIAGVVDVHLTAPRGYQNTACRHDLLAKVRSVLHENAGEFDEFIGMDYALQALAKLAQGRFCKELMSAIENMLPESFEVKRKIKILDEALELLDQWTVNDRVKISSMFEMLVPTVYSVGTFYSKIFNLSKPAPAVMADKTLGKIRDNLLARRAGLMKEVSKRDRPSMERT